MSRKISLVHPKKKKWTTIFVVDNFARVRILIRLITGMLLLNRNAKHSKTIIVNESFAAVQFILQEFTSATAKTGGMVLN